MRNLVADRHKNEPATQGRYDLMSDSSAKETGEASPESSAPWNGTKATRDVCDAADETGDGEATVEGASEATGIVLRNY
jgi:hypothetical protein